MKCNILNFFICKVNDHNTIHLNQQKSCLIEHFFLASIYIILDLTDLAIANGFSFYHYNFNYLEIDKIGLLSNQAFVTFKLQHSFWQRRFGGLRVLSRATHFIMYKLIKFYMKRSYKKIRYRDVHRIYVLFLVLYTRWSFEPDISIGFDFQDIMAFGPIPCRLQYFSQNILIIFGEDHKEKRYSYTANY